MERLGRFVFAGGAAVSVLAGVISTLNLGTICALGEGPPASMLSYPALCFMFWAYGVPLGLILAATGVLMMAGTPGGRTAAFAVGVFVVYAAIVIANDPMPHVPPLFGIGGALILGFYFCDPVDARGRPCPEPAETRGLHIARHRAVVHLRDGGAALSRCLRRAAEPDRHHDLFRDRHGSSVVGRAVRAAGGDRTRAPDAGTGGLGRVAEDPGEDRVHVLRVVAEVEFLLDLGRAQRRRHIRIGEEFLA
jgi:hypothetical protein